MILPLIQQIHAAGLPEPEMEVRFCPPQKHRFDFAYSEWRLAIECEGGTWSHKPGKKSRHTTGTGYAGDCRKYNEAALLGWTVLRFTTDMIASGEALTVIERALELRRRENAALCGEGDTP